MSCGEERGDAHLQPEGSVRYQVRGNGYQVRGNGYQGMGTGYQEMGTGCQVGGTGYQGVGQRRVP